MASRPLPSQEELRQLLRYDAKTGKLFWQRRPVSMFSGCDRLSAANKCSAWNARNAGREAFKACDGRGYLQGQVLKYHTTAHRVIWAMVHGYWPEAVDHIDGDGTNNRLSNLRAVSQAENARNLPIPRNNTTGFIGVRVQKRTGKWEAHIGSGQSYSYLGSFCCRTAAVVARLRAEGERGYHTNHGKRRRRFARHYSA